MRRIAEVFLLGFVATIPLQEYAASQIVPVAGTVTRLVGIAAAGVALTTLLQEAKLRKVSRALLVMTLFVGFSWLSVLWGGRPTSAMTRSITNMQLLAMVLIFSQFAWNQPFVRKLFQAYVIGSWSAVFVQIQAYRSGTAYAQEFIGQTIRYTAFDNDPNEMALTMALAIPFAWYLVATATNRKAFWNRFLVFVNGGYLVGAAFGVLLTGSRGGLIALTLAALALPLSYIYLRASKKALLFSALVVGSLIAVNFIPAETWKRLATISEAAREARYDASEANVRVLIWEQGLQTFISDPRVTVVGVGAANFMEGVEPVHGERFVAHNTFISVLVELGIIGFLLFTTIYIWCWRVVLRRMEGLERITFICVMLCWTSGVMFLTYEQQKETWLIFGVILARETALPLAREGSLMRSVLHTISGTPPRIMNRSPRARKVGRMPGELVGNQASQTV
ncbi:MAG: O-antigen ligase family protein [Bacteroidota bacterium]